MFLLSCFDVFYVDQAFLVVFFQKVDVFYVDQAFLAVFVSESCCYQQKPIIWADPAPAKVRLQHP